ncbi:MAG: acetylglutamate kinase [Bacteroidota bacterium]
MRPLNHELRTESAVVVKLGGAILADPVAVTAVWESIAAHRQRAVVVHGGGPQTTALARRLGHEPRIVAGRRVTTDLDLDVALYVLRGELNARLVASARAHDVRAVGVSGADGGLVSVHRRPPREIDGEAIDFGHVGDIDRVDPALLASLLASGFVPVVATVCADDVGALYNVNADTVASELAAAIGASRLDLVTDAGGVRRDAEDPASLLSGLTTSDIEAGIAEGWIAGGMRPKMAVAQAALDRGVRAVRVCGPSDLADATAGTTITP